MKNQMTNMLIDVITWFQADPVGRRAKKMLEDGDICVYERVAGLPDCIGCAIGMYISDDKAKHLRGSIGTLVQEGNSDVPKWMRNLPYRFLEDLQYLHDNDPNWSDFGLSKEGISYVIYICTTHGLPYNIVSTHITH